MLRTWLAVRHRGKDTRRPLPQEEFEAQNGLQLFRVKFLQSDLLRPVIAKGRAYGRQLCREKPIFPFPQLTITQILGLSGSEPRTGPAITSPHAAEDLGKNEIALARISPSPKSR